MLGSPNATSALREGVHVALILLHKVFKECSSACIERCSKSRSLLLERSRPDPGWQDATLLPSSHASFQDTGLNRAIAPGPFGRKGNVEVVDAAVCGSSRARLTLGVRRPTAATTARQRSVSITRASSKSRRVSWRCCPLMRLQVRR